MSFRFQAWAAWYNTWLLIKSRLRGIVFSVLFLFFSSGFRQEPTLPFCWQIASVCDQFLQHQHGVQVLSSEAFSGIAFDG